MDRQLIFIGGYSKEIVVVALENGELKKVASYPSGESPSILAVHPSLDVLYAANEVEDGKVEAFAFDRSTGELSRLGNPVTTCGSGPAAISVDPSGKWLLFANYNGGSYGVIKIDQACGELKGEKPVSFIKVKKLEQPGQNEERQEAPHPHQMITDHSGRYVIVCDLGNDFIHLHALDKETGVLSEAAVPGVSLKAATGPRHMVFSSNNQLAYSINELANSIDQFLFDGNNGSLSHCAGGWPTLDRTVSNNGVVHTAAEIVLSPDEKFLYASNRGEEQDTIALFSVDSHDGKLTPLGFHLVGGSGPRHFALDPSGEFVVVALEKSNKITLLRRCVESGRLSSVCSSLEGVTSPTRLMLLNRSGLNRHG